MSANWLDKTISFIAPTAAAKRARARLVEQHINSFLSKRAYDGATAGRRGESFRGNGSSANTELRPALQKLRERSRDLIRNEPFAARAQALMKSNIVGTGIIPQPKGVTKSRSKSFADLWRQWGETLECDADGQYNFYGLQALIVASWFESGEVLIRRRRRFASDNLSVPLQLQVLESDHLDTLKEGPLPDGYIVQGIEFDKIGNRRAYWLFDYHPGERVIGLGTPLRSQRIPAEEILHIFLPERPGQVRGVPRLAPIMLKMKDYSDFSDATLLRQKIAACFTAFVHDVENGNDLGQSPTAPLGEKLEPGIIEVLPPGRSVTFGDPPPASSFGEFSREQLRAMASGLGLSYEAFTGDLSGVNFSSARMGWLEMQRNIEFWRWQFLIPKFCEPVWEWFTQAAAAAGYGVQPVTATWTAPRREAIDPTSETNATISMVRAGLKSYSEAVRETGFEPSAVLDEIASDMKTFDKLGLVLDLDARKMTKSGIAQTQGTPQQSDPAAAPSDPLQGDNQQ